MYDFEKSIVNIVVNENKMSQEKKNEIYWTDGMVAKTIWYIVIMLVAIVFKERIGIWIFATIVWYMSTFKSK